ncbi:alkylated DNA repair protein alkB homolog 8 [Chelonus insularis]|uniref:alkylated DNA repair protein alkB homolog 8 n=1 Tax=Chelonus insularis TaxID=460826 RepID=UPI0015893612|nr:alkylated DNA repair protein alkB homolog 8 [Chelonus insularis]
MENRFVNERKCLRKQKRAQHRLARDMNIECSEEPTQNLVICNVGIVTGLQQEFLESILLEITESYEIIMPLNKSYCFIKFDHKETASKVYNYIHGKVIGDQNIPLYLTYSKSLPDIENEEIINELPRGLKLIKDFITIEEENLLLNSLKWNENDEINLELKHRKVMHFGYEFDYSTNKVDPSNPIKSIPNEYKFLQELFEKNKCGNHVYDQLTINRYQPGQGIPPHIDTHSVFEDPILSLSLGSACVMDFRKGQQKIQIVLPARSLLIMSQDARYAWSHGICPRKKDVIKEESIKILPRGTRTSFTFRKIRTTGCDCKFKKFCDSRLTSNSIDNSRASQVELLYVHDVYENISNHFDETRHKPWPNVSEFLESLELGSIVLDVGCGNGKYLSHKPGIFKIGCDRSSNLTKISRNKSFEVLISDCLQLPFNSNSFDAAISIAVIHHLSTHERRKEAFLELLRVLRPGGRCLVYVWAKEQKRNDESSVYLKYNSNKCKEDNFNNFQQLFQGLELPVHENRTNFLHNDVLVPWKRKTGGQFLRYYHVFDENEFQNLCSSLPYSKVQEIYYDQGNWCTILQKT